MIEDWIALCTLKARYCRAIDEKDWAGWSDLVTDGFVMDVSDGTGLAPFVGREAALAQITASIATAVTAHQVHLPELAIDGDHATGIWAMQDRVLWGDARPSITGYGHYRERYVKQDGRWRIAELRLTRLRIDVHPPRGER